jgi:hypothetical protein
VNWRENFQFVGILLREIEFIGTNFTDKIIRRRRKIEKGQTKKKKKKNGVEL